MFILLVVGNRLVRAEGNESNTITYLCVTSLWQQYQYHHDNKSTDPIQSDI